MQFEMRYENIPQVEQCFSTEADLLNKPQFTVFLMIHSIIFPIQCNPVEALCAEFTFCLCAKLGLCETRRSALVFPFTGPHCSHLSTSWFTVFSSLTVSELIDFSTQIELTLISLQPLA